MIEVISVKFKNRGKSYFFSPEGKTVKSGQQVIVETSKGMEIADCCHGNHMVEDTAVVQPLRPVVRIATEDDLRVAEYNKKREKEAFDICQQKIAEHGLDMKLVDVECNFEGNKTMFFFTSDGRVDFRELVKDLAGIFRNRIELRQIGVRDEAKMLGGLGICGRPFCCSKFLDEFQPVSTKMAKVQSMSLNPSKISGSCGRLMCCLRYEQEAYEELVKNVPKQGAFVETPAGYGTVTQINLLRQLVKVKLDGEGDDTIKTYRAVEVATVPGGRPKDGETPPSVLKYIPVPEEEEEEVEDEWAIPERLINVESEAEAPKPEQPKKNRNRRSHRGGKGHGGQHKEQKVEAKQASPAEPKTEPKPANANSKHHRGGKGHSKSNQQKTDKPKQVGEGKPAGEGKSAAGKAATG
ncbi:MAG: stage 0 sporulation family protein [Bacillota bacterium]|nr:stage 0 sporulation family protein [Bacillota bacterium]